MCQDLHSPQPTATTWPQSTSASRDVLKEKKNPQHVAGVKKLTGSDIPSTGSDPCSGMAHLCSCPATCWRASASAAPNGSQDHHPYPLAPLLFLFPLSNISPGAYARELYHPRCNMPTSPAPLLKQSTSGGKGCEHGLSVLQPRNPNKAWVKGKSCGSREKWDVYRSCKNLSRKKKHNHVLAGRNRATRASTSNSKEKTPEHADFLACDLFGSAQKIGYKCPAQGTMKLQIYTHTIPTGSTET